MKTKKNLIIFIIVTLTCGWFGVLVDSILTDQPEGNSLGMGLWLILPFLTGIVLRIKNHDWRDFGIKLHIKKNIVSYGIAILIYPLITLITVGIALMIGGATVSDLTADKFLPLMLTSLIGGLPKNIFEEFSWRGYLTPKLISLKVNSWLVYLISGLVWALWHGAYYMVFLPDELFTSQSRGSMVLSGCVVMVCWAVMYTEIYRLTKSVWPCVLMHTIEDALPNVLVMTGGFVTFTDKTNLWLNPVNGIAATVIFIAVGLLLRKIRIHKEGAVKKQQ